MVSKCSICDFNATDLMLRIPGAINRFVPLLGKSPNGDTAGIVNPLKPYFNTVRSEIFINSPPNSPPVTVVVDYENSPLNKLRKEVVQLVPG